MIRHDRLGDGARPLRRGRAPRRRTARRSARPGAGCTASSTRRRARWPRRSSWSASTRRRAGRRCTSGTTRAAAGRRARGDRRTTRRRPARCPAGPTSSRTTAVLRQLAPPRLGDRRSGRVRAATTAAARPQPTSPSPRRTQAVTSAAGTDGMRESRAVPAARLIGTVRVTSGPAGAACGSGATRRWAGWSSPLRLLRGHGAPTAATRAEPRGAPAGRAVACTDQVPGADAGAEPRCPRCDDGAHDPRLAREAPARRRGHVRRRRERYDVTNDVLSLGQDRLLAAGRRGRPATPAPAARARPRRRDGHLERAVRRRWRVDVVPADFSLGMLQVGHRRRPDLGFTAGRRHAAAVRRRELRRRDDVVRAAQRGRPRCGARASSSGSPGRVGGWSSASSASRSTRPSARSTPSTSCARCRRSPGGSRSNPESYVYLAESIQAWPAQRELAERIAGAGWAGVEWRNLSGGIVALHRATRP